MKKYIRLYWIVIAVFAAISPLFRLIPYGLKLYILLNALAVGYLNYVSIQYVLKLAKSHRYTEIEDLKTILYTNSGKLDPQFTPRIIMEETEAHAKFYKINYVDIVVVLVLAALLLNV